jgi:hypothetical protein
VQGVSDAATVDLWSAAQRDVQRSRKPHAHPTTIEEGYEEDREVQEGSREEQQGQVRQTIQEKI